VYRLVLDLCVLLMHLRVFRREIWRELVKYLFIDVQKMGRIYVLRVCKDLAGRLLCFNYVVASKLPLDFDVLEKLCTLWYPGPYVERVIHWTRPTTKHENTSLGFG